MEYKIDTSQLENSSQYDYLLLTESDLPEALQVIRESFFPHELIHKIVQASNNVKALDELEQLCIKTYQDGVSVIAKDKKTQKIVCVGLSKLQTKPKPGEKCAFEIIGDTFTQTESKAVMNFMVEVDSKVDLFIKYNTDILYELMFLGTLPQYCGRHIALDVYRVCIQIASQTNAGVFTILCTSPWTEKMALKLNFQLIYKGNCDELQFENGEKFSSVLNNNEKGEFTSRALPL